MNISRYQKKKTPTRKLWTYRAKAHDELWYFFVLLSINLFVKHILIYDLSFQINVIFVIRIYQLNKQINILKKTLCTIQISNMKIFVGEKQRNLFKYVFVSLFRANYYIYLKFAPSYCTKKNTKVSCFKLMFGRKF